jgi:hypothetical protein
MRTLAVVTLMAALAAPALAADPPMIINMPSANKALAAPQNEAKPAGQLPQVVNNPSATNGTKPASDAAKPTTAPVAVMALPSVFSVSDVGTTMSPYAGLSADYSMSMYGGPAYMSAGFPMSPYAAGAMFGAGYFGSSSPASGYFYTFAPPAVIYRDITTTPLGKTAHFSPDGTVFTNPAGYVGYAAPVVFVR